MALKPLKPLRIALTGSIACGKSLFAKFLRELGVQTLDADDIVHELIPVDERRRLAAIVFSDPVARKALEARIHPVVRDKIERWFYDESNARGSRSSRNSRCPNAMAGSMDSDVLEDVRFSIGSDVQNHSRTSSTTCITSITGTSSATSITSTSSTTRTSSQSTPNQIPSDSQSDSKSDLPVIRIAIIPLLFECKWDGDYDIILCISSPVEEQIRRMVETRGMTRVEAEARLSAQLPQEEKLARSHYVVVNDSTPEHLREEAVRCVEWLRSRQH